MITPLIHLLFAEGIATESHGQNIILVHKQGWPTRVLLKDFHDGVRYSPAHLAHPELAPELDQLPPEHAKTNSMSFILTDDLNGIRDFSCACLFFVALTDIAIFLNQNFDLPEKISGNGLRKSSKITSSNIQSMLHVTNYLMFLPKNCALSH